MRVIGYHICNGIIANSDGEYTTEPPYIDFLLQPKPDSIKLMYYLAQNVSALCRATKMSEYKVRQIHESASRKCNIPPYKIRYVQNRFLNVQKGYYRTAPYAYFYDAHQYDEKITAENDTTVEGCIVKAERAQKVGEEVYRTLNELGMHTEKLISPVRTFEDTTLKKLSLPSIDNIPEEAGYMAYECCAGNWLEAFQIGHWDKAWDYDINSAYPSIIAELIDLKDGEWVHSKEKPTGAIYGRARGTVKVWGEISPVNYRAGERGWLPINYTPVGSWETHMGMGMMDFIKDNDIGKFETDDAWWWVLNSLPKYPFRSIVDWLFIEKEKATGIKKEVIKRIMAGIYGKFLEARKEEFGRYFNPVYAAEVEDETKMEVAWFILTNKIEPIHVAVDGVVSPTPVVLDEQGIGQWRLSNVSPCICAGTGNVAMSNNGNGDFHLTYDWLKQAIEKNSLLNEYKMSKLSPVTVGQALIDSKDFEKIGTLRELVKSVGVGQDEKRCYRGKPKNGGELLSGQFSSSPWDISLIGKPL